MNILVIFFLLLAVGFSQAAEEEELPDGVGDDGSVLVQGEVSGEEDASRMDLLDASRKIHMGDALIYSVLEERETPLVLNVSNKFELDVPLLGQVSVSDHTCRSLAEELKKRLEVDFFYRATVLVRHQHGENSRGEVTIIGQVKYQGSLSIPGDRLLTVTQAILAKGGLSAGADTTNVILQRRDATAIGNPELVVKQSINVAEILEHGDFSKDVVVENGDVIIVPRVTQVGGFINIFGAVNSPGLYDLSPTKKDLTVSQAILLLGHGFTKWAKSREVLLLRDDESLPESERVLKVNVKEIIEEGKKDFDPIVRSGDTIKVEEKFFNF